MWSALQTLAHPGAQGTDVTCSGHLPHTYIYIYTCACVCVRSHLLYDRAYVCVHIYIIISLYRCHMFRQSAINDHWKVAEGTNVTCSGLGFFFRPHNQCHRLQLTWQTNIKYQGNPHHRPMGHGDLDVTCSGMVHRGVGGGGYLQSMSACCE